MRKVFVFLLSIMFLISCDSNPRILKVDVGKGISSHVVAKVENGAGKTIRNEKSESSFVFYNLPSDCTIELIGYDGNGYVVEYASQKLGTTDGRIGIDLQPAGQLEIRFETGSFQKVDMIGLRAEDGTVIASSEASLPFFFVPNNGTRSLEIFFTTNGEEVGSVRSDIGFLLGESTVLDLGLLDLKKAVQAQLSYSYTQSAEVAVSYDVPEGFERITLEIKETGANAAALEVTEEITEDRTIILSGLTEGAGYIVSARLIDGGGLETIASDEMEMAYPVGLESVSLELDAARPEIGGDAAISVSRFPENATMMDDDAACLFSSSNPDIVDVDKDGRLHLKANGTAYITYHETNNNISSMMEINVALPEPVLQYTQNGERLDFTFSGIDNEDVLYTLEKECGENKTVLCENTGERTFSDNDVISGNTYTYTLTAALNGETRTSSVEISVENPGFIIEIPSFGDNKIEIISDRDPKEEIYCISTVSYTVSTQGGADVRWILNGYEVAEGISFSYSLKDYPDKSNITDEISVQELICIVETNGVRYSKTIRIKVNTYDIEVVL